MRFGLPGIALACLVAAPAWAEPRGTVRTGTEGERGRLVFDWTERVPYSAEREGDRVRLRFGDGRMPDLSGGRRVPRNVVSVVAEGEAVVVLLAPGARSRVFVLGNRVVLDALDPAPGGAQPPSAAPAPARPQAAGAGSEPVSLPRPSAQRAARRGERAAPARAPEASALAAALAAATQSVGAPVPREAGLPVESTTLPTAPVPTPSPSGEVVAEAPPPTAAVAPRTSAAPIAVVAPAANTAPAATEAPPPAAVATPRPSPARSGDQQGAQPARIAPGLAGPAMLISSDAETGAAVLRRGGEILIVMDATVAPDLSALATDPQFGAVTAEAFPGGVLLRMPIAPPARLASRRVPQGWQFEIERSGAAPPPARAIVAVTEEGPPPRIVLRAARPGRVLAISDPETGAPLLVATMREAGQAVSLPRGVPEARLLVTMLGAAVLARSDHIVLRALPDRIVLQGSAQVPLQVGPVLGAGPPVDVAAMQRVLDLPTLDRAGLLERLRMQQAENAAEPPLARVTGRRNAGETLLALGLAQEAQAIATLALRDDPRAREDARLLLLHGAAAVAAHRPAEAGTLDDARLPDGEEAALWRALRRAAQGGGAEAGAAIGAGMPLLLAYPEDLRARLLPLAAQSLMEAGEWSALRRLADVAPEQPALAMARARMAEEDGRLEEALAQYAAIGAGTDRLWRARALRRSVELRLTRGMVDAAGAAAALDALLYAWRGDVEEVRARVRIAELHLVAGVPRAAFTMLEETARLFPDQATALRAQMEDALGHAIATEPPLAAVTLQEAHGAMLTGAAAERAARTLADRLIALDLTEQAGRLLRDAMARTSDGALRASFGTRLAALRMGEGDADGTLDALGASETPGLAPGLAEERSLLTARALAMRGDVERAVVLLDSLGVAGAVPLAELRAGMREWSAAAAALTRHIDAAIPAEPLPLSAEQQRRAAQLASYLALAGDTESLAALRARLGSRMGEGPLAESFVLLTGDPMRGTADLPRLARELDMLRALPTRLEALRSVAEVTR